jgi:hypothetical protein
MDVLAFSYTWVIMYLHDIGFKKRWNVKARPQSFSLMSIQKTPYSQDYENSELSFLFRYKLKHQKEDKTQKGRTRTKWIMKLAVWTGVNSFSFVQWPSIVTCTIATYRSQLTHWFHQLLTMIIGSVSTILHPEFLSQVWKRQEGSTMVLDST